MNLRQHPFGLILVLLIAIALAACGGVEERKAKHMQTGKAHFEEENYEKARLEFKNVIQIDPKDPEPRFWLARTQEKLLDLRAAAGEYLGVLQLDEDFLPARERLGRIYLLGRATDQAEQTAQEILARDADNPTALAIMAGVSLRRGQTEAAVELAREALLAEPGHEDASALLASIYVKQEQAGRAIEVLEAAVETHPESRGVITLLAALHEREGQTERSEQLLKRLMGLDPDALSAKTRLAQFYVRQGRIDDAEGLLEQAIAADPQNAAAKLALIDLLTAHRGPEQGEQALKELIAEAPDQAELRFALARMLEGQQRSAEAKEVYRALVDRHGSDPEGLRARNELARLQLIDGDREASMALIEEVLAENAGDASALMMRGQLALADARYEDAIADLRSVLSGDPDNVPALKLLAQAHLRDGDPRLARESLARVVELVPSDTATRFDYGQLLAQDKQWDRAQTQLQTILNADPSDARALNSLIKVHLGAGDYEKALEAVDRLESIAPDSPLAHYYAGVAHLGLNQMDAAATELKASLELEPRAIEPLSALVRTNLARQQPEQAIKAIEEILTRAPDHVVALNLLGEIHLANNDREAAEEALRAAVDQRPEWWLPYRNLALAAMTAGDRDAALAAYGQGMKSASNKEPLLIELGLLYERSGEPEKAISNYEAYLADNPASQTAANNLAMLLVEHRNDPASYERAEELTRSLEARDNAAFLDTIGWVHYKRGAIGEAVQALERAVRLSPESADMRYHLGKAYLAAGDSARARRELERAIAVNEDYGWLEDARAVLNQIESQG